MSRYWKADAATSRKIIALLDEWSATVTRGIKLAKRVGASDKVLTGSVGIGTLAIVGFIFKDQSNVDRKQFVRLKGSSIGWRPRRGKTKLADEFYGLRSELKSQIADLIGIKIFNGLSIETPGVTIKDVTAYISTGDGTNSAKGCKRISDVEYEKIIGPKGAAKR